MNYVDYSTLIDSGLVLALAIIVWAAYRELRKRVRAQPDQSMHIN